MIGGKLGLLDLCNVARKYGMLVIRAYKPDMHVCNEIALWGTPAQMKATEAEWEAAGNEKPDRGFKGMFGIESAAKLPREKWVDQP